MVLITRLSFCLHLWDQSTCKITFIFSMQRTFLMRSGSNLSHYAKIGEFEVLELSQIYVNLKLQGKTPKFVSLNCFGTTLFTVVIHSWFMFFWGITSLFRRTHSVSFRVLQIGQNHFSSHIFINFCLIPQSFALIAMCDVEFSGMNEILLALSWRFFL